MSHISEIENKLLPLFGDRQCAILDVPTYSNVGDQLIWAGMEEFFKNNKIRCVYRSSCETFAYKKLSSKVTICLVGGGNFGDLWRGLQDLKNKIVKLYPNHKIVIFPQSVYYSDMSLCESDSAIFAQHKDLYICARDEDSFVFFQKHFVNNVILVPDMVLYLSFQNKKNGNNRKTLFLKREDKEMIDYSRFIRDDMVVCDWPTHKNITPLHVDNFMKKHVWRHRIFRYGIHLVKNRKILCILFAICFSRFLHKLDDETILVSERWEMIHLEISYLMYLNKKHFGALNELINTLLYKYHLPLIVMYAIDFMQNYETIYTTRLHGGLLALLLGKNVYLIDNSYGKISAIYRTWLSHESNVSMIY